MRLDQSHKDNQHRLIKIKCALVPIVIGVILPLVSVYSHRSGISSYLRVLRIRAWAFLESMHVSMFRVIIMPTSHPPVPHPLCYCCHIVYIYMCSKHIEHHYCFCLSYRLEQLKIRIKHPFVFTFILPTSKLLITFCRFKFLTYSFCLRSCF